MLKTDRYLDKFAVVQKAKVNFLFQSVHTMQGVSISLLSTLINADKCPSRAETCTEPDPLVIELIRPNSWNAMSA